MKWAQALSLLGTWNNLRTRKIFIPRKEFQGRGTNLRPSMAVQGFSIQFSMFTMVFVFSLACPDQFSEDYATDVSRQALVLQQYRGMRYTVN